MTFLVADDDPDDQDFFREAALACLGEGCSVIQKTDAVDVLDYLLGKGKYKDMEIVLPDAIVLDLNMPKLTGFDILQQIKKSASIKKIPVYILTTSWDDAHMKKSKQLGASGFFTKPVDPKILVNTIKQIVTEVERGL